MNGRIQQYWRDVKALEETLPEFVWLVAIAAGAPGFVTQTAALTAAKMLHAKSHRVATDEEVAAHRANESASVKQAKLERMRRSGAALVVVEKEVMEEPATSVPVPRRRR